MALTQARNRLIQGALINVWDFLSDAQITDVKTNGSVDVAAGVQAAIDYAISQRHQALFFPAGRYLLNSTITINEGLKLFGNGSQGSTEQFGTTLLIGHSGDGIHFSGSGRDYAGTGGGMMHFLVLKTTGNGTTGKGVVIDDGGTGDINKRMGEMQFNDVMISAGGTSEWSHGIYVDGTPYVTAGTAGIRSIVMHKVRVVRGNINNQTVVLKQVTHFSATHLQVEQGGGGGAPGITMDNQCDNVQFANANINGDVNITGGSSFNGFVFMGRASSFTNSNSNVDGIVCAQIVGAITNNSQFLNFFTSNTSFTEKLEINTLAAADDLIQLKAGASAIAKIGVSGTQIARFATTVADGEIHLVAKNASSVDRSYLAQYAQFRPSDDGGPNLGDGSFRWNTVYATTGTINTSDQNEKRDLQDITDAESRVAIALKSKMKSFRFNSAYSEKGEDARIHFGIIAQDIQAAFDAEGLDPDRYAVFCSDTWTDDDGVEHTRLGVRYSELFAFIISTL